MAWLVAWERPAWPRWNAARSSFRCCIPHGCSAHVSAVTRATCLSRLALIQSMDTQTGRMTGNGVGDTLREIYRTEGSRGFFRSAFAHGNTSGDYVKTPLESLLHLRNWQT